MYLCVCVCVVHYMYLHVAQKQLYHANFVEIAFVSFQSLYDLACNYEVSVLITVLWIRFKILMAKLDNITRNANNTGND